MHAVRNACRPSRQLGGHLPANVLSLLPRKKYSYEVVFSENVLWLLCSQLDHCPLGSWRGRSSINSYVTVPFVLMETGRTGIILADPTSDQLWIAGSRRIRNHMMVLPSKDWEYKTDWRDGENLYPEIVQLSTCHGTEEKDYNQYMENAFNNAAVVA